MNTWRPANSGGYGVDREKAKEIVMNLCGIKNNILSTISGKSVAMMHDHKCFESDDNGGSYHDIYKMMFYEAVDTKKVHDVKEAGKWGIKLAQAFGGVALSPTGLGELGDATSGVDFSGPEQGAHNKMVGDMAYRALKKSDKWRAAATQPLHAAVYAHFITKKATVANDGKIDRNIDIYLYCLFVRNITGLHTIKNYFNAATNNNFKGIKTMKFYKVNRAGFEARELPNRNGIMFNNNNNNNNNDNDNNNDIDWAILS